MSDSYGRFYPPSTPRRVEGGLAARSARGDIGASWWSRRFVTVLESFALGSRLTRGKNYARRGQVLSLAVAPGAVTARVQGSRATPYKVAIGLAPFSEAVWQSVDDALAAQAIYCAALLAGQMPADLEDVLGAAGAPLFPRSLGDIRMSCSCPDWEVPCKHLAATFYLLAERFDDDPFAILHWRGRSKDVLLARLRDLRPVGDGFSADDEGLDDEGLDDEPLIRAGPGVRGNTAAGNTAAGNTAAGNTAAGKTARGTTAVGKARSTAAPGRGGAPSEESATAVGTALALADLEERAAEGSLDRFWLCPVPLTVPGPTMDADVNLLLRQLPEPAPALGGAGLVTELAALYTRLPDVADEVSGAQ